MNQIPLFELIAKSGPVALLVIIILGLLSVGVWASIIIKSSKNRKEKSDFKYWFTQLRNGKSFSDVQRIIKAKNTSTLGRIAQSAISEIEGLASFVSFGSLEARTQLIEEAISRAVDKEKFEQEKYLGFLSLCAGVSPFLGLFGTVWGIMHSFLEIGNQGSANITVVAPGIAEALVTTIIGLSVAIPASSAYNYFVAFNRKSEAYMYGFGSELMSLFQRGDLKALERSKSPNA